MGNIFQFSEFQLLIFSLVLVRVSAFFVSWPVFGTSSVPAPIKILTALSVSMILLPIVPVSGLTSATLTQDLIWLVLKEASIGVLLGYLCRLFFFAVSISGQLVSMAMGLSNGQIMNPTLGSNASSVEQTKVSLATLFFLAINGHHLFIRGLTESFTILPLAPRGLKFESFSQFGVMVQEVLVIGTKMSAPVIIAILFMNLAMGIVGRAVPQINVLVTSLPVNILVGFLVLIVSVPFFVEEMGQLLTVMAERLFVFMKAI